MDAKIDTESPHAWPNSLRWIYKINNADPSQKNKMENFK